MEVDKNLIKSWESVSKTIDPEHPDRIIFKFGTYGWSFPSQFKDGIHKNGITKEINHPGTKRMTEACSGKKTAIPEEPFVIPNSEIVWTIPFEISNGLLTEANKFARKFDIECNKALAKYKVKLSDQRMVGEEWYRLTVPGATKIREAIWKKLIGRELAKKEADAKKVRTKIQLKKGLQEKAHQAVLDELKKGTERFKGIAPTGFGKTVLAWKIFTDAYAQGLIKGKVSIMTAPSQFLCNKNSVAFDTYNGINGITGIVNQPIFSGQDVGVFENENEFEERKTRLEKQLAGHISSGNRVILHVCINSMKLVDEVLDTLGIPELDLMIVDEAHTLASHRDNNDKTYLGTVRNFCLFDENIKVSHRFFLTATEKNLVNPDILNTEQIFAYMNNEDYFGGYAFKFSYAECVVDGLIVPFRCKVFEYSDTTKDVVKMMKMGIDRFLLDDLALRDNEGDIGQVSINLIRVLVSSLKVIKERNKMLLIVSRNSHADLLENAFELLKNDPNYSFLVDVNVNKITTPYYPKPGARQDELEIIHESDEKHIIICGPWAITGTDCPSLDAVLWGFLPGTEISAAQGTGRGTRTHAGKSDLLVAFNLDLGTSLADLKNDLLRTIAKLHEGLFPAHDLELSYKVRKILGRTFNEVERDKEAVIKPEVRKLLDDFYDAASDVELFNFVNSSAFLNGGKPDYYTFEEIHKIAVDSPCITINQFFEEYAPSLHDKKMPGQVYITNLSEYKKIGLISFLGLDDIENLRLNIFKLIDDTIQDGIKSGKKYKDVQRIIIDAINPYFPMKLLGQNDKRFESRRIENPKYDSSLYSNIKKGYPLAIERSGFIKQYEAKYGGIKNKFGLPTNPDYYTFEEIHRIAVESTCTNVNEFFENYAPSLNDPKIPGKTYITIMDGYKKMGPVEFMGMKATDDIKDKLLQDAENMVLDCEKNGYTASYAGKQMGILWRGYFPYIGRRLKDKDPYFDIKIYGDIKKGIPLYESQDDLYSIFCTRYKPMRSRLKKSASEKDFIQFVKDHNVKKATDLNKLKEDPIIGDYMLKYGIPYAQNLKHYYSKEFIDSVFVNSAKYQHKKLDNQRLSQIREEIMEKIPIVFSENSRDKRTLSFLDEIARREGFTEGNGLMRTLKQRGFGIDFKEEDKKMNERLMERTLDLAVNGYDKESIANEIGRSQVTVGRFIREINNRGIYRIHSNQPKRGGYTVEKQV